MANKIWVPATENQDGRWENAPDNKLPTPTPAPAPVPAPAPSPAPVKVPAAPGTVTAFTGAPEATTKDAPTKPLDLTAMIAKYPKLKDNPQELAQLWMADAVKYWPNIGNAYMENSNAAIDNYNTQYGSLTDMFNNLGPAISALFNQQQGEYAGIAQNMDQIPQYAKDKFAELGITADQYNQAVQEANVGNTQNINFIKQIMEQSGLDFNALMGQTQDQYANLQNQSNQVGQQQQDFLAQLQQYLGNYTDKTAQNSQGMDDVQAFLQNLMGKSGQDMGNLLNQQQGEYAGLKGEGEGLQTDAAGKYQGIQDRTNDIWQQMWEAQQATKTGQLDPRTQAYIDQIYGANESLLNQSMDETVADQRKQLIDQMAGRGILTSGVTGRAYGEMLDSALRQKQKGMTEILKERATTQLGMPFQQAQAANDLLKYTEQAKNLTQAEQTQLLDILQTRYGMSKDNATLALQNIMQGAQVGLQGAGQQQQGYVQDAAMQGQLMEQVRGMSQEQINGLINKLQTDAGMTKDQAMTAINNLTQGAQVGLQGAGQVAQGLQVNPQNMNQLVQTLQGLTTAELNTIVNTLQTQYGMSNQNAQLALQNLMQGNTEMLKTIAQQQAATKETTDMYAKMFDQYGALGQGFVNMLVTQYENEKNRQAQIEAARAGASKSGGSSGILGSLLGGLFG